MQDTGLKGTDYVLRAFAFTISDFGQILVRMLPWMLPLIAIDMWPILDPVGYYGRILTAQANFAASGNIHLGPSFSDWLFVLFLSGVQMAMLAGFAIQRHRRVLSQVIPMERSLSSAIAPYVGYWLLTSLIVGFLSVMGGLIINLFAASVLKFAVPYMFVALLASLGLLLLRSVMVFPAIAVGDRNMTFRVSFDITQRSVWRMALAVILIFIPIVLASWLYMLVIGTLVPQEPSWRFALIFATGSRVLEFIGTAIFIAYISLVYAHKRGDGVPAPPEWDTPESQSAS